ncbi:Hypothetical predicted protein [Marmota monax]|uniref:Uncharacterized protein n=1 Tax=Marmota monax TaxID=9995 RepID=A0A5E4ANI7_MARMO|nr:hypothetical protein GHT09_001622 [Marmota monax]VTJ58715.1 Hypothetical predicted protein [Marmota monax]
MVLLLPSPPTPLTRPSLSTLALPSRPPQGCCWPLPKAKGRQALAGSCVRPPPLPTGEEEVSSGLRPMSLVAATPHCSLGATRSLPGSHLALLFPGPRGAAGLPRTTPSVSS